MDKFALKALKVEVSPRKVINITYKGLDFVFKTLSKKEYDEIVQLADEEREIALLVCEYTYLYPKNYDFKNGIAGLATFIATTVIRESLVADLSAIESYLLSAREKVKTLEKQCFIGIKSAFPEVTYEAYEAMSWQEILDKVALSEQILKIRHASYINAIAGEEFDFNLSFTIPEEKVLTEKEIARAEKEEVNKLYEQGLDPAIYYDLANVEMIDVVPPVLLGGRHWNKQDVVDAIRKETDNVKTRRDLTR